MNGELKETKQRLWSETEKHLKWAELQCWKRQPTRKMRELLDLAYLNLSRAGDDSRRIGRLLMAARMYAGLAVQETKE